MSLSEVSLPESKAALMSAMVAVVSSNVLYLGSCEASETANESAMAIGGIR